MTRIGIVAGIIIIVVAAIFFGFRKAAREHAANQPAGSASAASTAAGTRASAGTGSGRSSAAPVTAAPTVKRIDPAARQRLLAQIEAARARRTSTAGGGAAPPSLPPPELSKDYIRTQVRELIPLLTECYTMALETDPQLAGKLVVEFAIGGEPDVGGLVETSEVDAEASTITHPGMVECVRETMYAAEFVAPAEGGRVEVSYPFEFSP